MPTTPRLSSGVALYYEEHGSGEPLLLIMGAAADSSLWSAQIADYAASYRVIAFDNRGAGRSDQPAMESAYSTRLMAADAAGLLDALQVPRAHVAGLGLGSAVAQQLVLERPDLVATLELHGTWGRSEAAFQYAVESLRYPLVLGDREGFLKTISAWVLSPGFVNDAAQRDALFARILGSPHRASLQGMLGQLHAYLTHDAGQRLEEIRCPTLVTAGEIDLLVPQRLGHEVYASIPGARWHLFTGAHASHLSCLEITEEFNRVTLEFLEKHPISAG